MGCAIYRHAAADAVAEHHEAPDAQLLPDGRKVVLGLAGHEAQRQLARVRVRLAEAEAIDRQFVGLDAYEKAIQSDANLVLLGTPPGFRPAQYEAAVKAGKQVFMEKPLATDVPGLRRVMAANEEAKKKKLAVAVGHHLRSEVKHREIIKRIDRSHKTRSRHLPQPRLARRLPKSDTCPWDRQLARRRKNTAWQTVAHAWGREEES